MAAQPDTVDRMTGPLPPPPASAGVVGWLRDNLFSTWYNGVITVVAGALIALALWYGLRWALVDADWAVIARIGGRFAIGGYNTSQACPGQDCFWRPQAILLLITVLLGMAWGIAGAGLARATALVVAVAAALFALLPYSLDKMGMDVRLLLVANLPAVALGWALARYTPLGTARWVSILAVVVFVVSLVLLRGLPGISVWQPVAVNYYGGPTGVGVVRTEVLQPVSVNHWGGLMLNLLLATVGIALSLPIGIALALGRRSRLPVLKSLCVFFIEVFRGMPLITLLFMAHVLGPLVFPGTSPLLRAGVVITLFSSAYMAENIRGGLQALHPGQAEAARALGLAGWQTTLLISLPQALRNVIPAIVGQFIGLFKDTSLVYIISMLDIVEIGRTVIRGNVEFQDNARELYVFLALAFWVFTYGMSYVSGRLERHLGVGER